MMRISVIVTTYNRPDALRAVLVSLAGQTMPPLEVIVADDGSQDDTLRAVQDLRPGFPSKLIHVWHPDEGFRAAAIRNLAVAASTGDYLIFLDGDCIARPSFVANHMRFAEESWFVAGHRILLSDEMTLECLAKQWPVHQKSWPFWFKEFITHRINRFAPLITLPDASWRKFKPQRWEGARTCNLAMWRKDFQNVNGFDEKYAGWGHEDADLAVRLISSGISRKDGRFGTGVFHLWHKESDRAQSEANMARLRAVQSSKKIAAEVGLSRYDAERVEAALR
jgi:GT2 family glycosyltransferase